MFALAPKQKSGVKFRHSTRNVSKNSAICEGGYLLILYPLRCIPHTAGLDKDKLILRYSIPHFLPNFRDIAGRVAELNAAIYFDTRAMKIKIIHVLE